jgi:DNA-binding IclR family transcriptional regulator
MRNPPAYPINSADRVLTLLQLLYERGELRVVDAANELGVAHSTAHRLLTMLRHHDFARRDGHHVYRAGRPLAATDAATPGPDIRLLVHEELRELVRQSGETAHLVTLEGNGARFVDGVEGTQALRCGTRIGLLLPAHATSGGKALLAELPVEQIRRLYPRGLPRSDTAAIADMPEFLRELARVRRRGYATNCGESEPGLTAVGSCLRDSRGNPVGALALAAPSVRCDRNRMAEFARLLQDAAQRIYGKL